MKMTDAELVIFLGLYVYPVKEQVRFLADITPERRLLYESLATRILRLEASAKASQDAKARALNAAAEAAKVVLSSIIKLEKEP